MNNAKELKIDEFYTCFSDIKKEIDNYKEYFKNKIIYCNCDNPKYFNFYYYFILNFKDFGIKKLITTHYKPDRISYKLEYSGGIENINEDKQIILDKANKLSKKHF
jgi:hypothetical protein